MTSELATIVAAVIAALMIIVQLGRQHSNELKRQEKATRSQLKLEIYQEISKVMTSANDALIEAGGMARSMPLRASSYASQKALGWDIPPITDRAVVYSKVHYDATDEMVSVIFQLEKYLIVCPDLDIFRTAFACGMHDLERGQRALFDFMVKHLPMDDPTSPGIPIRNVKSLDSTQLQELDGLAAGYANATMDLTCYLGDLRTELQMLLLGDLFPANIVPRRQPPDPTVKVITLDPASIKILRHGFDETEWGRERLQMMQETGNHFGKFSALSPTK
jgi:hypothetical protein